MHACGEVLKILGLDFDVEINDLRHRLKYKRDLMLLEKLGKLKHMKQYKEEKIDVLMIDNLTGKCRLTGKENSQIITSITFVL